MADDPIENQTTTSTLWAETDRSAALHAYDVLDTPREEDFDELARVASEICGTPIAVVNLVDTTRQFFKAEVGLGVRSTPLETAFCSHALLENDVLVIPDATKDTRLDCNPLVTQSPHLRAYAGALLKTSEGLPIGTICVLDYQPRQFTDAQIQMLRFLAKQTMTQLELRRKIAAQAKLLQQTKQAELEKLKFERVVTQASDFIGIADATGHVSYLNEAARRMVGLSVDETLPANVDHYIAAEDRQMFNKDVRARVKGGEICEREIRLVNFANGTTIPALCTLFPMRENDGAIVGYGIVTKDITAKRVEEERRNHIIFEAAHRMKNTLAVIEAIVSQTLRTATSLEEGRHSISKRVQALARAQDILTTTERSVADIVNVVEKALEPHDPGNARISVSGPSHPLSASQSLGLSLAIHELATNAVKYGSLRGDTGKVRIEWTVSECGEFTFEWRETGGSTVLPPATTGFGSKLIQNLISPYFEGRARHEFLAEGVKFSLEGNVSVVDP
ncbi:HWE histidine kinase domain-containing protein [Pararhizobium sp.]|uniref:HWE histidine kinase domain-containing protein n=1 Tax=Pararhizobium sp. TaxID=1977563 RepID=UPI00271DAB1A|nr:HWE histidine kinase domain-containing protein [Pararhizobium sp.]MDO9415514.1 HWE histidine kinase domain-containing protein [Pararhizobium sp.]